MIVKGCFNLANVTKAMYKQADNYERRIKKKKWEKLREVLEHSGIFIKHNGKHEMLVTVRRQSKMDIEIYPLEYSMSFIKLVLWKNVSLNTTEDFKIVEDEKTEMLEDTLESIESRLKEIEKGASILTEELILEVSDFESNLRKQEWERLKELIIKSRINVSRVEEELLVISPIKKPEIEIKIKPNAFFEESNKDFVKLEYLDCGRSLEKTTVSSLGSALSDIQSKLFKAGS